jgi:hypothetical protein
MQHYVIKFVSDLRQLCGLLWFPTNLNKDSFGEDLTIYF